jgi:2-desacetyl-2-hydroxyethyl bacteriochlorophyllide A dehydrogenase
LKALILRGLKSLVCQDIPAPEPGDGEILIKVKACGICGSDIRYYMGDNPWALHTLGSNKTNPPNMLLGHEITGIVESAPGGASRFKPGDRVTVLAYKGCGKCRYCLQGRENICEFQEHLGHGTGWENLEYNPGGMAEYCTCWADKIYGLPDSVSFDAGVLLDGAAVALHALTRSGMREGDAVLIYGCGSIGLIMLQLAKLKGAARVICVDVQEKALATARLLGADETVAVTGEKSGLESLKGALPGEGADVILDSVGEAALIEALPLYLARGGTLVSLAVNDDPVRFNPLFLAGERTVTISANNPYEDFPRAMQLAGEGKIRLEPIVTHRFPLDRGVEAFEFAMDKGAGEALKIVINP